MKYQILKFSANWCSPCKLMAPAVKKLQEEYPDIQFTTIDIDHQPDIQRKYQVKAVPTLIFLHQEEEIERVVGVSLITPLRKICQKLLQL